ncbi:lytic transglycosylase domain-containing protein [Halobacteriovorax sp. HLS]|uniref:lytic transglycosylase domain-containing protein n=1 Tax=Halobacteriovorax sp. HLS TaxID=2234000 RepID=UPI0013E3E4E2|nr:lytic transglycosylase domain-containing protein [Halobacteriovorax sp. HLS]
MRLLLILPFLVNCAGPYTPFGSAYAPANLFTKDNTTQFAPETNEISPELIGASISYIPKYQALHASKDFKIIINDIRKISTNPKVTFLYNGQDISKLIEQVSTKVISKNKIIYKIENLTLPPNEDHHFVVLYGRDNDNQLLVKNYPYPKCDYSKETKLSKTSIQEKAKIKKAIESITKSYKINSALVAGLIAQESSFNPKAVSWAKAVGLTQVTPVAEQQILTEDSDWSIYPNWGRMPASILKTYIQTGKINKDNDWKLNPETSIEGGIKYLNYLEYFWSRPQNKEAIPLHMRSGELYTSILLASYNSGPSRVKRRLLSHGKDWLRAHDLNEAKKYIGNVKSYCSHFTIE